MEELLQFGAQAMSQRALRPQLIQQRFRLRYGLVAEVVADGKQFPPASGNLLFGKQK